MKKINKANKNVENPDKAKALNFINDKKKAINHFKKVFADGSNYVKIGNKEVSESDKMMNQGLTDKGFTMLSIGHANIKKGLHIIQEGRKKLNELTQKMDSEIKKITKNSKKSVKGKVDQIPKTEKPLKKVKIAKKPVVKIPNAPKITKEIKKKSVKKIKAKKTTPKKPKIKINPLLMMIKNAEENHEKNKKN